MKELTKSLEQEMTSFQQMKQKINLIVESYNGLEPPESTMGKAVAVLAKKNDSNLHELATHEQNLIKSAGGYRNVLESKKRRSQF